MLKEVVLLCALVAVTLAGPPSRKYGPYPFRFPLNIVSETSVVSKENNEYDGDKDDQGEPNGVISEEDDEEDGDEEDDDDVGDAICPINSLYHPYSKPRNRMIVQESKAGMAKDLTATDLMAKDLTATDLMAKDLTATGLMAKDLTATDLMAKDLTATDLMANDFMAKDLMAKDLMARGWTIVA